MKFGSIIVATMLLAGCASQQLQSVPPVQQPQSAAPVLSDSPTPTNQMNKNRDRDLSECERESAFAGAGDKGQVFNKCMKARGGRGPRRGGNSYLRYPCLKNFFHNCLITNDLKATKA